MGGFFGFLWVFWVRFLWPTLGPGPIPLHRAGPQADLPHRLLGNTQVGGGISINQIWEAFGWRHRLNMDLDLQSLFGLHVTWCAQLFP